MASSLKVMSEPSIHSSEISIECAEDVGMGLHVCSLCMPCPARTSSSVHLLSAVFGSAMSTY